MDTNAWFDQWRVIPWGVGGDDFALACPKGNQERPNRTPACYIEVNEAKTVAELREIARLHRRDGHR